MSNNGLKAPSQIFRWFEKMKANYEQSIKSVLSQFETMSQHQQTRLDKAHTDHIDNIKSAHSSQVEQYKKQIKQLKQDISYYQQQISQQQSTIDQLNKRYDTVMSQLLTDRNDQKTALDATIDLALIDHSAAEDFASDEQEIHFDVLDNETVLTNEDSNNVESRDTNFLAEEREDLYLAAKSLRSEGLFDKALALFFQLARSSHPASMGALGRAYFIGEGVEIDQTTGLAWLIKAADHDLQIAIKRVDELKETEPTLYQQALERSKSLNS